MPLNCSCRKMISRITLFTLLAQMSLGQDVKITAINSTSGLYYEKIGQVYLSNSQWKFITSIDYKGYLLFYEYLHQQATKLQDFCDAYKLDMCKDRLGNIRDTMKTVAETDNVMANFLGYEKSKRTKRSWDVAFQVLGERVLGPFVNGLVGHIFGNNDNPDLSVYDSQLSDLQRSQHELADQLQKQATYFIADSQKKTEDIVYLKATQTELELKLKIQTETQQQDAEEKNKKIDSLELLLGECKQKILNLKAAQEKTANDAEILKENVKKIYESLEFLKRQVDNNTNRIDKLELETELNSITTNFLILLSRFQSDQKTLFDVLVNANRGFLDPYIITPLYLIQMMLNVESILPEDFKFPFHANYENARKLYNLVEPSFYLYNGSIIFVLKMALVQKKAFNMYKMTSLPFHVSHNTFGFVLPNNPYLVINQQDTDYALVSENDFQQSCKRVAGLFVCNRIQTTQIVDHNIECEVNIYLNRFGDPSQCDIRLMALKEPVLIQLLARKSWIYVTPETNDLVVDCGNGRKFVDLSNTGILQLGNCTASLKQFALTEYLDPHIPDVYANFSSNVNLMEHIRRFEVPVSSIRKLNIPPYRFEDLKTISHSVRARSGTHDRNIDTDENKSDLTLYIIIIGLLLSVVVLVAIIVSRHKLLKLAQVFIHNNSQSQVLPQRSEEEHMVTIQNEALCTNNKSNM